MSNLDTGVFDRQKSLIDQTRLQDDFNLKKAAALQSLASGGIDAQSKANIFKTQLLSGAAAGGQQAYDTARANLAANGIDTSEFAPDVATASGQLSAARQAQSPLGTLLNAGLKAEGNLNSATTAMGGTAGAAAIDPLSAAIAKSFTNTIAPGSAPAAAPAQASAPLTAAGDSAPIITQAPDQGSVQIPAKPVANNIPIDSTAPVIAIGQPGAPISTPQPAAGAIPAFVPPAYDPTLTQAANQAKIENARKDYETNNMPAIEAAKAKATGTGKNQADASKSTIESNQNYAQVVQTLDAIKSMATDLPQEENFVGPGSRAFLNQNLGDGNMAAKYSKFKNLNEAQTIGIIKELTSAGGGLRMTRTLENIINRGYLIDPTLNPQGKIDAANAIQTELRNAAVAANNTNAQMNGGQELPMTSPLTQPSNTVLPTAQDLQDSFNAKKFGGFKYLGQVQ